MVKTKRVISVVCLSLYRKIKAIKALFKFSFSVDSLFRYFPFYQFPPYRSKTDNMNNAFKKADIQLNVEHKQ